MWLTELTSALLRIEKKLDSFLDQFARLQHPKVVAYQPLSSTGQACPLCKRPVKYVRIEGLEFRNCGCKTPD